MDSRNDEKQRQKTVKISVIIPAYNREKTIKRCINSINKQTVQPFEIIVVDDGSSDHTVEILDKLKSEYGYLRVIKQNHRGAQAARNLGILNAKGEYIAFLDSDDEWLPQMLETCIKYINAGHEDCVLYGDGILCESGREKRIIRLSRDGGEMRSSLLRHPGPMFQMMVVKKDKLLQIDLLDEQVVGYQEWDTAIRLSRICEFVHVKKPLFIYHIHKSGRISSGWNGIRGYFYVVQKNRKEIIEKVGRLALYSHYKTLAWWTLKKIYKNTIHVVLNK